MLSWSTDSLIWSDTLTCMMFFINSYLSLKLLFDMRIDESSFLYTDFAVIFVNIIFDYFYLFFSSELTYFVVMHIDSFGRVVWECALVFVILFLIINFLQFFNKFKTNLKKNVKQANTDIINNAPKIVTPNNYLLKYLGNLYRDSK